MKWKDLIMSELLDTYKVATGLFDLVFARDRFPRFLCPQ